MALLILEQLEPRVDQQWINTPPGAKESNQDGIVIF